MIWEISPPYFQCPAESLLGGVTNDSSLTTNPIRRQKCCLQQDLLKHRKHSKNLFYCIEFIIFSFDQVLTTVQTYLQSFVFHAMSLRYAELRQCCNNSVWYLPTQKTPHLVLLKCLFSKQGSRNFNTFQWNSILAFEAPLAWLESNLILNFSELHSCFSERDQLKFADFEHGSLGN